ncbi:MAG: polysaccharide biosynthesis tyrosine autokinase, partial [Flavobacteriaceae bacterium]|nr:polysaccharide biosynthesis tyrosine autokinase [Flavobacteriaceae bacterium]
MKKSDILIISLKDQITLKAELILNTLTANYNKNAIENKSQIAINTNEFIEERLLIIEKELSNADSGIQEFKTSNSLTDLSSEASLILDANSEIEKSIIDIKTQLQLADYVTEYLENNTEDIIPENLGLGSGSGFSQGSQKYNELVLERNRISKSSKDMNPIIINLNNQIAELRKGVHQSLTNLKKSLSISLSIAEKEDARLNARITEVPRQEKEFKHILRRQRIIESLYLFLLEKREENAISLAATIPSGKIIDSAIGSNIPISPKRKIIYLAALIVGFLIPFGTLYIRYLSDNYIHTSKQLEAALKMPFLGVIPKATNDEKIVISSADRSAASESFRLLRTNINFILSDTIGPSKTIYVTSTIPSEGKTFVAINLATALALSNKKVLLIGADIRKPKLAEYLSTKKGKGLTHYLTSSEITVQEVIQHIDAYDFDMIQSGISPPNPTELLMNGRFDEMLDYVKEVYDYIVVDTAPVSVVSDTLLFNQKADMFLYVVRAHFIDKRMLEIPKKLYDESRLQNMAVVMNCSDSKKGYNTYGYGYGYGYG